MDLARVDLNLLVVLDAVVEERNLAKAAARLGMTPSALSQALNRLRRLVDDPVLVRTQGKMVPTARAWELHAQVRRVLQQVQETLAAPVKFDPKTSRHTFTIAASEYAEFVLLPGLVQKLAEAAPGVRVAVRAFHPEKPFEELETGRVDLVLAELREVPPGLKRLALAAEHPVAVVRKGNAKVPRGAAALTPAQAESLDFVQVVPRGGDPQPLADTLRTAGLDLHVALKVPSFLVAPMVVAQTDHAAILPERVARHFAGILPLRVLELPVKLEERPLCLVWRDGEEPEGITFLRTAAAQVGKAL